MHMLPLHHGDEPSSSGFDGADVAILIIVLLVLGAIGFGIWKLVQRIRGY